ncbi:hypothetical protein [Dyella sp. Tek66A03]|uniref:hypothetical protein n=1 Tax=Dyella sp. Tek66A03 TaxID=3458298 RepID=UPI00403E40B4
MSREWPFYLVIALAAFPAPLGIFFVVAFNAKTYVLVRNVQKAYGQIGRRWPFWSSTERQIAFVLSPDQIVQDEPEVAPAEKAMLLQHRRGMKRHLLRMFAGMFGSFALAILLLLTLAALNHIASK